jgi:hypothetical protein
MAHGRIGCVREGDPFSMNSPTVSGNALSAGAARRNMPGLKALLFSPRFAAVSSLL